MSVRRIFQTSTGLGNGGTFTGNAVDLNNPDQAGGGNWQSFGAVANSDQSGTLFIDGSFDAVTWRLRGSLAITSAAAGDLSIPIRDRYVRVRYTNGATPTGAGNFAIHASLREI